MEILKTSVSDRARLKRSHNDDCVERYINEVKWRVIHHTFDFKFLVLDRLRQAFQEGTEPSLYKALWRVSRREIHANDHQVFDRLCHYLITHRIISIHHLLIISISIQLGLDAVSQLSDEICVGQIWPKSGLNVNQSGSSHLPFNGSVTSMVDLPFCILHTTAVLWNIWTYWVLTSISRAWLILIVEYQLIPSLLYPFVTLPPPTFPSWVYSGLDRWIIAPTQMQIFLQQSEGKKKRSWL